LIQVYESAWVSRTAWGKGSVKALKSLSVWVKAWLSVSLLGLETAWALVWGTLLASRREKASVQVAALRSVLASAGGDLWQCKGASTPAEQAWAREVLE
jgi:hypothetical protein